MQELSFKWGCFSYFKGRHVGVCHHRGHLYASCTSVCPLHPYAPPYPLYICTTLYTICSICHWDLGGIFTPHMPWGLWGRGISASVRYFCVSTSICLSIQNSQTSCFSSLWGCFFTGLDVCYASCCSFLYSVFIMSHVSNTTATITTPPVTVLCSGMSPLLSMVTMAPSLMGLWATLGQYDVVLTPRHSGGVVGLSTVPHQQPQSQMPLQAYANYAMGHAQVGYSFRVETPTILYFFMFDVCSGVCFLLSGDMHDALFTYGGSTIGICTVATLWNLPMAGICAAWQWSLAHTQVCTEWLLPPQLWVGGSLLVLNQLSSSHSNYMVGHTALGTWQRVTFPAWWARGLLFQVWFHPMTWSTLNLWWALNLVILVWWLGIRWMTLLAPGMKSHLLLFQHLSWVHW